jgi:hypothetical protein
MRPDALPARFVLQIKSSTSAEQIHGYTTPFTHDGFLATNTLLTMST